MSNTINNLINEAAEFTGTKKRTTNTIKNLWNVTATVLNQSIDIANDIVSVIPTVIEGSKEALMLTGAYVSSVTLNIVLEPSHVEAYRKLSPEQRKHLRSKLIDKLGADTVKGLENLLADEVE